MCLFVLSPEIEDRDEVEVGNWAKHKKMFYSEWYTGCYWKLYRYFNHELLASCRTRKKYFKNSVSKNKMTFIFWATIFLNCF
jgi:hypothetical protein